MCWHCREPSQTCMQMSLRPDFEIFWLKGQGDSSAAMTCIIGHHMVCVVCIFGSVRCIPGLCMCELFRNVALDVAGLCVTWATTVDGVASATKATAQPHPSVNIPSSCQGPSACKVALTTDTVFLSTCSCLLISYLWYLEITSSPASIPDTTWLFFIYPVLEGSSASSEYVQ